MTIKQFSASLLLASLVISGCMTTQAEQTLRQDLFAVQKRLLNIERQNSNRTQKSSEDGQTISKRIATQTSVVDSLTMDIRKIQGELDILRQGIRTGKLPDESKDEDSLRSTLSLLSERIDGIDEDVAHLSAKTQNVRKKKSPKTPSQLKSVEDFSLAFKNRKYKHIADQGPNAMTSLRKKDLAQVRYIVAESYFKLGKLRDAALAFNTVLENKPDKKFIPHAQMRLGDCFRHLGDQETAEVYYQELVETYPKSKEAEKARGRLAKMSQNAKKKVQGA